MRRIIFAFLSMCILAACSANYGEESIQIAERGTDAEVAYETIDLEDIDAFVKDGYVVADVREVDEYESGHIPGAIHAPLSDLETGDLTAFDPSEKYVIICRSGNRSVTASNILSKAGYHVVNVSEGMSTWTGEIE